MDVLVCSRYRPAAREVNRRVRARETASELSRTAAEPVADPPDLRVAIAGLPAGQRAVLALFYLEGLSVAEAATALAIPPGTVKTRLMHARNCLRDLMKGDDHGRT